MWEDYSGNNTYADCPIEIDNSIQYGVIEPIEKDVFIEDIEYKINNITDALRTLVGVDETYAMGQRNGLMIALSSYRESKVGGSNG